MIILKLIALCLYFFNLIKFVKSYLEWNQIDMIHYGVYAILFCMFTLD